MPLRGHVMFTPFDASSGAALTSATVNVYSPGTVTPVAGTLFDKNGNTLANPLASDATTGLVDFYMNVAQEVDLLVSKTGFTARTYSNVPVLDDAGNDLTALMTGTGDIVYSSAANTPARLAIGATGTFLTNTGASTPGWSNTISAGGLTITAGGLTVTAGNVGVGTAPLTTIGILLQGSTTVGTSQYGVYANQTGSSTGTTELSGVLAQPITASASYTVTTVTDFHAFVPSKGAGSVITNVYGLLVDTLGTPGSTRNVGVSVGTPSFTVNADLFTSSEVFLAKPSAGTGDTTGHMFITAVSGAPTGVPTYDGNGWKAMRFDVTNNKLWVYNGGWKGVVLA